MAHGAQAHQARKEELKKFLKVSGFDHPKNAITVGEFHRKFRLWYPQPLRSQMDTWAAEHRYEKMPRVETSVFKDKSGKEQVRMLFSKDGKITTLTTAEGHAQIGSIKMVPDDFHRTDQFIEKLTTKDPYFKNLQAKYRPESKRKPSVAVTAREWAAFTKNERSQYLLQLSHLTRTADFILNDTASSNFFKSSKKKSTSSLVSPAFEVIARWVAGEPAFCQQQIPSAGQSCIVAGWIASYGENLSCGGVESGRAQWNSQIQDTFSSTFPRSKGCSSGSSPCNPLVYGFQQGGGAYCVPNAQIREATKVCNGISPLNGMNDAANARRIAESWLKAQGNDTQLQFDAEGKLREDQYQLIAGEISKLNDFISQAEQACDSELGQKIQGKRDDQASACEEIRKRRLALEKYIIGKTDDLCEDGSAPRQDPRTGDAICAVTPVAQNNRLPWGLIIGGGAILLCLLWFCKDDDKVETPDPTNPIDDCDINPKLPKCQEDPCKKNPKNPNCQPPPPPPPPVPTGEGGKGKSDPDSAGGVR